MDTLSPAQRSALMSRIRSKNTHPELVVRSLLHRMGYRFRLHGPGLPGRPDIVLPRHRKIIFVHGCFWHGHNCRLASKPKSNTSYWSAKIASNRSRDERHRAALMAAGWSVLSLWECEIRRFEGLEDVLRSFMASTQLVTTPDTRRRRIEPD